MSTIAKKIINSGIPPGKSTLEADRQGTDSSVKSKLGFNNLDLCDNIADLKDYFKGINPDIQDFYKIFETLLSICKDTRNLKSSATHREASAFLKLLVVKLNSYLESSQEQSKLKDMLKNNGLLLTDIMLVLSEFSLLDILERDQRLDGLISMAEESLLNNPFFNDDITEKRR